MGYVNKVMKIIEKGILLLMKIKSLNFIQCILARNHIKTLELI
jgi:hypothetical protein